MQCPSLALAANGERAPGKLTERATLRACHAQSVPVDEVRGELVEKTVREGRALGATPSVAAQRRRNVAAEEGHAMCSFAIASLVAALLTHSARPIALRRLHSSMALQRLSSDTCTYLDTDTYIPYLATYPTQTPAFIFARPSSSSFIPPSTCLHPTFILPSSCLHLHSAYYK